MISLAIKMLIGNKASCIGVIFGIFLATLLISQQSAIFLGLISRSYRTITDIPAPNIWVVDPATESDDKLRAIPSGKLDLVRSIPGVEWAVPINMMHIPLITQSGVFEIGQVYGIDEATLIGAPINMVEGRVRDLRREGGIIVDIFSANGSLAKTGHNGEKIPLRIGDELEINNRHAVVVGISKITQGFYPQPIIFTSLSSFASFNPLGNKSIAFIAAKTSPHVKIDEVTKEIHQHTELDALTKDQFKNRIVRSFLKTGILINFGLSLLLGLIIGFSIAGQVFYIMTVENLAYYAVIKAIGGTHQILLKMIVVQALVVGIIGFSLGIGTTYIWGMAIKNTTLAFLFPWQLWVFTIFLVLLICLTTALISIRKVFRIDPKSLMGT